MARLAQQLVDLPVGGADLALRDCWSVPAFVIVRTMTGVDVVCKALDKVENKLKTSRATLLYAILFAAQPYYTPSAYVMQVTGS